MFREILARKRYAFHEGFPTWTDAIEASCAELIREGAVPADYPAAIINNIREYGPYIVIMPGIALPHAMHENVRGSVISFMKCEKPVAFSPEKTATCFLTIAEQDPEQHMHNIQLIAQELEDEEIMQAMLNAEGPEDLARIQRRIEEKGLQILPE